MAMQSKFPHIRLDEQVWDDPILVSLSPRAFKVWVFAIAWSKAQHGRVPDGIITPHGLSRVGATDEDLAELSVKLLKKQPDGSYEIVKYCQWQVTAQEEAEHRNWIEQQREFGKQGAEKRWRKDPLPAVEEGFDQAEAFEAAFEAWPDSPDPKFREGRSGAREAFCANITTQSDYDLFSAALTNRLRVYKAERSPNTEKRRYLGAFKNFCNERWREWIPRTIPKQQTQSPAPRSEPVQEAAPPAPPVADDLEVM